MLQYRGHPYFDIGVATIAAFVGKKNPQILTEQDLSMVADYITREYVRQPLRSFLTVVFPNSGFTQPAFFNQPDKQLKYIQSVLWGFREETSTTTERCIFTGKPAVGLSFDVKDELPLGRAFRQHVPLLTGEDVINFHPYGDAGLPVSGEAMLAIQAFPLGCAKSAGRLLVVHSDNPDITYHFARTFLAQNRRAVQLAQAADSSKMPEPRRKHRTLLIETLLEAELMRHDALEVELPFSVSAYHLSNSGQGPGLDIYHLPMQVVAFLREMETARYRNQWHRIVGRAWEVDPDTKAAKGKTKEPFQPARNWIYEDLFELPENATRFIRTYFLRFAIRYAQGKTDPRQGYSLSQESDLVSWDITANFLRRILNMEPHRIEQIRKMGDGLAEYVSVQNDRRFFRDFFTLQNYDYLRTSLIKANLVHVRAGHSPILALDPFIEVFEDGNELARRDWRLARDLVLIRMVEQLHTKGWLGQNQETMEAALTDSDTE
ncbi:type I-B CRISPR-associated protein Cas8b1/Cst1 [bacterium]|nr:type I-B CRISPR-associated protein Cas8b1/Cst1 [bacterium]